MLAVLVLKIQHQALEEAEDAQEVNFAILVKIIMRVEEALLTYARL